MGVLAVDKPETMDASGVGAGGVEKSDALGRRWVADIVNPHTDTRQPRLVRLVGHQQQVIEHSERIRAQIRIGQIGLQYDLRIGEITHIQGSDVLRGAFVPDPKNAAPIRELLESNAFARVAKSVQVVMGDQLHVFDFLVVPRQRASSYKKRFQSFERFQSFKSFQTFKLFEWSKRRSALDDGSFADGGLSVAQSGKLPRPGAA